MGGGKEGLSMITNCTIDDVDPIWYTHIQSGRPQGDRMDLRKHVCIVGLALFVYATAAAGERPFLSSIIPSRTGESPLQLSYSTAFGKHTFEPIGGDALEQNIGAQLNIGENFSLLVQGGMALDHGEGSGSFHAELLANVLRGDTGLMDFNAGLGYRREYSRTNVLLGRAIAGKRFDNWMLYGNVLFERALASERDDIDIMTSIGVSYRISDVFRIGLEGVGQDLEGFWDDEEAEGGARLYVGPTIGVSIVGTPWHLTVGGGAILRGSTSNRTSGAVRDIPLANEHGFLIRGIVTVGL
jgi:hypothetical protein